MNIDKLAIKKYLKVGCFIVLMLVAMGIASYKADMTLLGFIGIFTSVAVFLLWFAIIGKIQQSLIAMFFTLIAIQLMNQAKIYYFKSRLFFTDFILMVDGNNFDTLNQYWEMYVVILLLIIIVVSTLYWFRNGKRYGWKSRLVALILCGLTGLGIFQITLSKENNLTWQSKLPNGRGVLINLWMTVKGIQYESPSYEGSDQLFLEKIAELNITKDLSVKPDIVIFLQESTVDRDYFLLEQRQLPKLSMFDPNAEFISAYGALRLQTTGGGTWLSEFSFATGLSTDDFAERKYSVLYTVAPHTKTSFYQELKNNGYYTVLLTPMTKDNYNTQNAYHNFGVDLVLQPQDLGYDAPSNTNLWKITSHEMLEYVYKILEKHIDQPVAVFMLSMNEHGPYDDTADDTFGILPYFEDSKVARRLNDYLTRQVALNDATDDFASKVLNRDKPTLFLYFGDHQPALYGDALRKDLFTNPAYVTQFFMKDNFNGKDIGIKSSLTDINFLGGIVLERIQAEVSPYYDANIKMRYLCNGLLEDCPDQELVNSYKHYIYNTLKAADKRLHQ